MFRRHLVLPCTHLPPSLLDTIHHVASLETPAEFESACRTAKGPPKRSKQQSHADEKINFVSEPETEDSLLVGAGWRLEKGWAEAWSTEEPFPAALIPPNLVPSL